MDALPDRLAPFRDDPAACALLLDLDGTIAPIVPRPEDVRLVEGVREALVALSRRLGLLGFVSGRALSDLERIVNLPAVAYSGNHGLELRRPARQAEKPAGADAQLETMTRFRDWWPAARLEANGVWLEDKEGTLTFHYRGAPDPDASAAFLASQVAPVADGLGLEPRPGRMTLEVRPRVALDKGTAVRALLAGTGLRHAAYVGDDRTDADAWRALRELRREGELEEALAVGVSSTEVPESVLAEADIVVPGPPGVRDLLRLLAAHPTAPRSAST